MSGRLHVHRAARVEALVEILAALPCPPDPFEPEVIALQSRGMGQWLEMRLAERRGIVANVRFTSPDEVIADAIRAAAPAADHDSDDQWSPGHLRWHILAALPDLCTKPEAAPIARYLEHGGAATRDRRRVLLAGRIAEVFHRYTIYRPDLVRAWVREPTRDGADWQPALWRQLAATLPPHPGARAQTLLDALDAPNVTLPGFPQRAVVFGVNTLPPLHLDVLRALARHRDVHLMLTLPAAPDTRNLPPHALVASLDRLTRDLTALLDASEPPPTFHDHFPPPPEPCALATLQADMLRARHPDAPHPVAPDDRSLQVHACHGALRQVEVLRDALLDVLERDPTLQPRDVIVMTPDIDTYAPLIEAVFGDGERERGRMPPTAMPDEGGFPALHRLDDLSLVRQNPHAEAFLAILDLAPSRLTLSALLDVLALGPVMAAAGHDADALPDVRRWLSSAGARWGRDATHRAEHGLPDDGTHTWRFAFDRLLMGHALANEGHDVVLGVHPRDDVEGSEAIRIGRLIDYCERLFDALAATRAPRPLTAWRDTLDALLDALLVAGDDAANARCQPIREVLAGLADRAAAAGFDEVLDLAAVRALLDAPFSRRRTSVAFLSGGMTFCTMVPMRNIPFRVVALLGMDDGSFPRGAHGLGFDLLQRAPRPGDRTQRDDDRQIWLETALSARDHLIVTYSGRSPVDNHETPPCGPVAELLATLRRDFAHPLVTDHPLSPFSPRNFGEGADGAPAPPFAYDRRYLAGAHHLRAPRTPPAPFFTEPLPARDDDAAAEIDLDALVRFFKEPTKAFCRALGVSLDRWDEAISDQVPLSLDHLDRWRIGDKVIGTIMRGATPEAARTSLAAEGELPPGALADDAIAKVLPLAEQIAERALTLTEGARPRAVPVQVDLGDVIVTGRVDGIYPAGALTVTPSTARAKHQLDLWIRHVALAASGQPRPSWLVARGQAFRFEPPAEDDARAYLETLVSLYRRGLREPLPFAPRTSLAWLKAMDKSPAKALSEAANAWSNPRSFPDGDDPHCRRVWGDRAPYNHPDFPAIARDVLGPLCAAMEEEALG